MKILANDGISAEAVTMLEKAGFEVSTTNVPQENLVDHINAEQVTGLLVRSATKVRTDIIDNCPSLKLIGRGGVGMDNIDVDYARGKGLEVVNTPSASSQSVAELAMGHLYAMARGIDDSNCSLPAGGDFKTLKKKHGKGFELRGKKLGIVGFGRIGRNLAKYALGAGMEVIPNDSYLHEVQLHIDLEVMGIGSLQVPVQTVDFETVLRESDIISIHIPAPADGGAVIGEKEIAMMKDGVCLVNTARGGVIDEDALIAGLNSGKIAKAGLDVFANEPTPREDILKHEKISVTPHIGAATVEAQQRIGSEMANTIIEFFKSKVVS